MMAKFLHTNAVSSELTDLIDNSEKRLWLISPYLRIPKPIRDRIKGRDSRNTEIVIIYRKDEEQNSDDRDFLNQLTRVTIGTCENLHAKCYLNENTVIITSMNLFQYSQQNNWEMGIKLDKQADPTLYEDALKEVITIIEASENIKTGKKLKVSPELIIKNTGFCIRCGKVIEFDPNNPLCPDCKQIWAKFSNPRYKEKYCHDCGKEYPSTYDKPLCIDCYKKLNP